MFQSLNGGLRIRGTAGSLLWGYRTAATLSTWRIYRREDGQWRLSATLARVDSFQCRQSPLLFTAPRVGAHDGMWCWGIESLEIDGVKLRARLGPPEQ